MMKNNWKKVKLGDFAEINPKVSLKKNEDYSFVPMEDIFNNKVRYVISSRQKKYTGGGAKFRNGDTLFARRVKSFNYDTETAFSNTF
ncbi:MAG: restriction endonuclease subunit S, partial [Candidatus Moraniibacteriota bacterium]